MADRNQMVTGGLILPDIQTPNIAAALQRRESIEQKRSLFKQQLNLLNIKTIQAQTEKVIKQLTFIDRLAAGVTDEASNKRARTQALAVFGNDPEGQAKVDAFLPEKFDLEFTKKARDRARQEKNKFQPIIFKEGQVGVDPLTGEEVGRGLKKQPREIPLTETRLSAIATGAIKDPNITADDAKRIQEDITAGRAKRRGEGITTTLPDGTVIQIGGPVTKAPGFGTAATNIIQKDLLAAAQGLSRLTQIENSIQDRFLTIPGKFKATALNIKDKLGNFLGVKRLTTEERAFLSDFSTFAQDTIENINLYIKEITGAQMSEKEANRLRKAIADIGDGLFAGDGPVKFRSKLSNQARKLRMAVARLNWINTKGIRAQFGPKLQGIETKLPLSRMPAIMAKRESEIMAKFKKQLPGRNQAEYDQLTLDRLSEEFGLVGNM